MAQLGFEPGQNYLKLFAQMSNDMAELSKRSG